MFRPLVVLSRTEKEAKVLQMSKPMALVQNKKLGDPWRWIDNMKDVFADLRAKYWRQ